MRTIVAEPLTPASYAPYGSVVMAAPPGVSGKPANQGTARRYDHLTSMENARAERAPLNVAVFRCSPRTDWPLRLDMLEKHPASTQLFVPMNARRYIVVVALGDAEPDVATLRAFVAAGTQGISYRPGVWHHPLLALDAETDFACAVYEDGGDGDCQEASVASAMLAIALP